MTRTMRPFHIIKLTICLIRICPGYRAFVNALESPMITRAPFVKRDGSTETIGSQLIGYALIDGSYTASSCPPGSTLKWEDKCGACVATSATGYAIWKSCEAESILVASNTRHTCGADVCYTALIFEDLDDKSPRSLYGCSDKAHQASLYITTTGTEATTTSITSNASTKVSSVKQTMTGSANSTGTQNPALTASTIDTSNTETEISDLNSASSSSESKDRDLRWIAGPIVGGIVGLIIIGFLIWFIMRRRKNAQVPAVPATPTNAVDSDQTEQSSALQFPTYQWQVQSRESSPRKGQSYNGYMAWTTSSPTDCSSPLPEDKGKES